MTTHTREIQAFFKENLVKVRSSLQEVSAFGESLSEIGHINDPSFSIEKPIFDEDLSMFGYDLEGDRLDNFDEVVVIHLDQARHWEKRHSIFQDEMPRTDRELIKAWSAANIDIQEGYAITYWKSLTNRVAEGVCHKSMFTRKVIVPTTFEEAFPSIYEWQNTRPTFVPKPYVSAPWPLPLLQPEQLASFAETLDTKKRKVWESSEKNRNKRTRMMAEVAGADGLAVSHLKSSFKWKRTIEMRALVGVFVDE
jgi:hypothetical protein